MLQEKESKSKAGGKGGKEKASSKEKEGKRCLVLLLPCLPLVLDARPWRPWTFCMHCRRTEKEGKRGSKSPKPDGAAAGPTAAGAGAVADPNGGRGRAVAEVRAAPVASLALLWSSFFSISPCCLLRGGALTCQSRRPAHGHCETGGGGWGRAARQPSPDYCGASGARPTVLLLLVSRWSTAVEGQGNWGKAIGARPLRGKAIEGQGIKGRRGRGRSATAADSLCVAGGRPVTLHRGHP